MSESKMKVTLDRDEYEALVTRSIFLTVLMQQGVDNWEGFAAAEQSLRDLAAETD